MEEAEKIKCYKRLIYKKLSKSQVYVAHSYRNQQKHLEFTFSIKTLSFHSRASKRAHKHIFQYLKWLNCWKSIRQRHFFNEIAFLSCVTGHALWKLGSSNCCTFNMKHAKYGTGHLYKDLLFVYLQPCVNENSQNLSIYNLITSPWKPSTEWRRKWLLHSWSCQVQERTEDPLFQPNAENYTCF